MMELQQIGTLPTKAPPYANYDTVGAMPGVDLHAIAYYVYMTQHKPTGKSYLGSCKKSVRYGIPVGKVEYHGSPLGSNEMKALLATRPSSEFIKYIVKTFDTEKEMEKYENDLIKHSWSVHGKVGDKGTITNLHSGGLGLSVGKGKDNPMYGKTGADAPTSIAVIESISGRTYGSLREASRVLGIDPSTIGDQCRRSREKILNGVCPGASQLRIMNGRPNPAFGLLFLYKTDLPWLGSGATCRPYKDGFHLGVVLQLDTSGLHYRKIASHIGVSNETVLMWLHECGRHTATPRFRDMSSEMPEILRLRSDGVTLHEISKRIGCSITLIRNSLLREGVGTMCKKDRIMPEVLRLTAAGASPESVGSQVGVTGGTIRIWLRQHNQTAANEQQLDNHFINPQQHNTPGITTEQCALITAEKQHVTSLLSVLLKRTVDQYALDDHQRGNNKVREHI